MNHIEDDHAQMLWRWAQLVPILREYLIHNPNGGKRNIREAARFKAMGVRAGVYDYFLPLPFKRVHGLWLELKAPKPHRSTVSKAQIEWGIKMKHQGYRAVVCYGFDEAKSEIEKYLAERNGHGE